MAINPGSDRNQSAVIPPQHRRHVYALVPGNPLLENSKARGRIGKPKECAQNIWGQSPPGARRKLNTMLASSHYDDATDKAAHLCDGATPAQIYRISLVKPFGCLGGA